MNEEHLILKKYGARFIPLAKGSKIPEKGVYWRDENLNFEPNGEVPTKKNVAVRLGDKLNDGTYLVAIDIDPRNGGARAWKVLADELEIPEKPDTLTVKTAGGGKHFYFKSRLPLKKSKLGAGIDFQGVGSYCVFAGSEIDGKKYEIEMLEELSFLPTEIEKLLGQEKKEPSNKDISNQPVKSGKRNDYLAKVAGMLLRGGITGDSLKEILKTINKIKCSPPLGELEVSAIARSISRYKPLIDSEKKNFSSEIEEIYDKTTGAVRLISDIILENSVRAYPQFALASSLSIIATCAQGSFFLPSFDDSVGGNGVLSLYQWLVAPSAAGKDSYRRAVQTFLNDVDERLCFSMSGSSHGLRAQLFTCNSGVCVIDEMQDEMAKLNNKNASAYQKDILTNLKELYNGLDKLPQIVLNKSVHPEIYNPILSLFALGTTAGFKKALDGDLVGGGLLSRFVIWPCEEVIDRSYGSVRINRNEKIYKEIIKFLKDIIKIGATKVFECTDKNHELLLYHDRDKKPVSHLPQFTPSQALNFSSQAKEYFIDFLVENEKEYKKLVKKNMANEDFSAGSIVERSGMNALKFASIHAIGRHDEVVNMLDAEFGIQLSKILCGWLRKNLEINAGATQHERLCSAILGRMKRNKFYSKTTVSSFLGRNFTAKQLNEAIEWLVLSGKIRCVKRIRAGVIDVPFEPRRQLFFILK